MGSLTEKLEHKQVRYRSFLERRLYVYRGWQSFEYFSELYLTLFDDTSNKLLQLLLLEKSFLAKEQAVVWLFEIFLDQLVRGYDLKLHEDFEKKVYFEDCIGIDKTEIFIDCG